MSFVEKLFNKKKIACCDFNWDLLNVNSDLLEIEDKNKCTYKKIESAPNKTIAKSTIAFSNSFSYFELFITNDNRENVTCKICIGLTSQEQPNDQYPGAFENSYGYMGDGKFYYNNSFQVCEVKEYGPSFTSGDVIGCGYDSSSKSIYFTKNGEYLGIAYKKINAHGLFPTVGLCSTGESIVINSFPQFQTFNSSSLHTTPTSSNTPTTSATHNNVNQNNQHNELPSIGGEGNTIGGEEVCNYYSWNKVEDKIGKNIVIDLENSLIAYLPNDVSNSKDSIGSVRSNIPLQEEFSYFEIIINSLENGAVSIGLVNQDFPTNQHIGYSKRSYGYHSDDGTKHKWKDGEKESGSGLVEVYGPGFKKGDIIGCGISFKKREIYFTKNGEYLGCAFENVYGILYPSVAFSEPGTSITGIFTPPFKYNHPEEKKKSYEQYQIESNYSFNNSPNANNCYYNDNISSPNYIGYASPLCGAQQQSYLPPSAWRRCSKSIKMKDEITLETTKKKTSVAMSNYPFSSSNSNSLSYFEVYIEGPADRRSGTITVGLTHSTYSFSKQIGLESKSYGYCSDGRKFDGNNHNNEQGDLYGPAYFINDNSTNNSGGCGSGNSCIIGCGINTTSREIFFTKNGEYLGVAFWKDVINEPLYPCISFKDISGVVCVATFPGKSLYFKFNLNDIPSISPSSLKISNSNCNININGNSNSNVNNHSTNPTIVLNGVSTQKFAYKKWHVNDVIVWLEAIGYQQYSKNFRDNNINGFHLQKINNLHLKNELGIEPFGHREDIVYQLNKLFILCNGTGFNNNSSSNISSISEDSVNMCSNLKNNSDSNNSNSNSNNKLNIHKQQQQQQQQQQHSGTLKPNTPPPSILSKSLNDYYINQPQQPNINQIISSELSILLQLVNSRLYMLESIPNFTSGDILDEERMKSIAHLKDQLVNLETAYINSIKFESQSYLEEQLFTQELNTLKSKQQMELLSNLVDKKQTQYFQEQHLVQIDLLKKQHQKLLKILIINQESTLNKI